MTAEAKVTGTVDGELFCSTVGEVTTVSFVLADHQRALQPNGLIIDTRVAWCQVLCRTQELIESVAALKPGDWVTVRGALSVLRPALAGSQCDLVLVSLVAEDVEICLPS